MQKSINILMMHNTYQIGGGEDTVFDAEVRLLRAHGVETKTYIRDNAEIAQAGLAGKVTTALNVSWSSRSYDEVLRLIEQHRPDLVHAHNTFPLLTPSIYSACSKRRIPVVQTLHNFRLICPAATLFREGRVCELCLNGGLRNSLIHRCYRNSFLGTAALYWMLKRNRANSVYDKKITRFIALTEFAKSKLIQGGLPAERIVVKPNFVVDPPTAGDGRSGDVVYVGRLSEEKGLRMLLAAWGKVNDVALKIYGDGPIRGELEAIAREKNLRVQFFGAVGKSEVIKAMREAISIIVPSLWYEGFPMVVLESYACGTPVLASRIGSLDEVVAEGRTGLKFEAGNPDSIADVVQRFVSERGLQKSLRQGARAEFDEKYTAEANVHLLMDIYRSAMNENEIRVSR